MGTRRFDLNISQKSDAAARLLFITFSKYEQDWSSSPHSHFFTEIFYVQSGEGYMQIEDSTVPLSPNTLVVINMQTQHTEVSSLSSPLTYYVIGVEGLHLSDDAPAYYHTPAYLADDNPFLSIFTGIYREMKNCQTNYVAICQNYLDILILLLSRKTQTDFDIVEQQKSSRECHKIKQYIEANYHDSITLDDLSNRCNLSKYYLSHKFSESYGTSPIAYLTQVRVNACKNLLRTTNHSIEEIADMTGFSSHSYLSYVFAKHCQMTPQQYRKRSVE
jgi:AraC-like DNA-binding protein/mannose-6-phosphate isomerase-like protein (cupin superfamily)